MNDKARAQATNMANFGAAVETALIESRRDLDGEIASFRNAKTALRTYLPGQIRSRKLMHFGNYNRTIRLTQNLPNSQSNARITNHYGHADNVPYKAAVRHD